MLHLQQLKRSNSNVSTLRDQGLINWIDPKTMKFWNMGDYKYLLKD